jgi:hypothetical protein
MPNKYTSTAKKAPNLYRNVSVVTYLRSEIFTYSIEEHRTYRTENITTLTIYIKLNLHMSNNYNMFNDPTDTWCSEDYN